MELTTAAPSPAQEEGATSPKALALPIGLREMHLTVEEAEKLRQILDDAAHPTHAGKEMPTADASVLKKDR
jgi:hypothetical protein